jgi:putative FmdB family regulatory protein
MPLYEYQCQNCGESFDKIVSFSEADKLPVCPECGAKETRKKITAGAFLGGSSNGGSSTVSRPPSSPFT